MLDGSGFYSLILAYAGGYMLVRVWWALTSAVGVSWR